MEIPWATEDPVAWARADRKRRQLAAITSLAGLGGHLVSSVRNRDTDVEATKREELELESRLGTQQHAAVNDSKSLREQQPDAVTPASTAPPPTDAPTTSEQPRTNRLAQLAERATTPLRRMLLSDPGQTGRLRHIAEMKGQLARQGDIADRLKAVSGYAKYADDPGALVQGVGGGELGIKTTGMHQPTTSAKTPYGAHVESAREALRAALNREPTTAEVTEKVDQQMRLADRRKIEDRERIKSRYARGGSKGSESVALAIDQTTGEEIPVPPKGALQASIAFDRDMKARQAQGHVVRYVTRRTPLGGGAPGSVTSTPTSSTPPTSVHRGRDVGAQGVFVDDESGIQFGTMGE